MKMFTKLWQWMMVLLVSSSVIIVQGQTSLPSAGKAISNDLAKKMNQTEKNEFGFTQDQMTSLEKSGINQELLNDKEYQLKAMEILGMDKENPFIAGNGNQNLTDPVATYTFSQAVGTYTAITGGTLVAASVPGTGTTYLDDVNFSGQTIPFNFAFNSITYTTFNINTNGFITFGATLPTAATYSPISGTTAYNGCATAFARDCDGRFVLQASTTAASNVLTAVPAGHFGGVVVGEQITATNIPAGTTITGFNQGAGTITLSANCTATGTAQTCVVYSAEIRTETIGTAPNRIHVIQFKNFKRYASGTYFGELYNFQIRLYETTNVAEVMYGNCVGHTTSTTGQVGLRGATNADYFNRTTTTNWAATTAGASNAATCTWSATVYPANGLTFIYTPPAAGAPGAPNTPNPGNGTLGVAVSTNLTWNFGTLTETYDLYLDVVNPPLVKVVDNAVAGVGLYDPPSNLNYSTPYFWQVIARNSSKLETAGPVWTFTTACGSYSVPWTEGFESVVIPAYPSCWLEENGDWVTTNNANSTYDADAYAGAQFLRESWSATNEYMWTPGFALTASTSYDFSFYWAGDGYSGWTGDVFYNTTQSSVGATQLGTSFVTDPEVTTFAYQQQIYTFVPGVSGDYFFAIRVNCPTTVPWYLSFDEFKVEVSPSCPAPSSLTATNITSSSADLGWTENGSATLWDIELGLAGFAPTGTPTQAGVTNPYTYGSLLPSTSYDYYVRADCGGGSYSTWSGPKNFATACASYTAPFTEVFQNTTIPLCWETYGPQLWLFTTTWPAYGAAGLTDHTGTGGSFAGVDGSGTASLTGITLLSPFIDISALTNPALKFYLFNNNVNDASYQTLTVDLWDGAAWNSAIYFWGPTDNDPNWVEVIVSLLPYTITGDVQFRFVVDKSAGSPFYDDLIIDDVSVDEGPTCPNPTGLGATNITTTSADLTWTSVSGLSDVEFGAAGFVPTGTPTHTGVTSPLTVTVTASSSYDFYVRDDCGGGDYSNWVGPYNFDTPCDVFAVPFSEDFALATMPACWTQTCDFTTDRWSVSNTANAGGVAYEMMATWVSGTGISRLITPALNLGGSPAVLSFKHFYNDYDVGAIIKIQSSPDGTTWTDEAWSYATGGGDLGPETLSVPITANTGSNVYIAWVIDGDHYQIDYWYVDDVYVYVPLAHDAALVSIDMTDVYNVGIITPMATVLNNGLNPETFNVQMTITGGYSSTQSVTLASFASQQVSFGPWNPTAGDYTVNVCTQLVGDLDPANDCDSKAVKVLDLNRDVYGYNAYAGTGTDVEGPTAFNLSTPGTLNAIVDQSTLQFVSGGTWANGQWYGTVYNTAIPYEFITIDPITGARTVIGDMGISMTGLSFNPATGIMYAVRYDGVSNSQLYTIDMTTGAPTLVGDCGAGLLINLAIDLTGNAYSVEIGADVLGSINLATGAFTAIGSIGFNANYAQDMEFDRNKNILLMAAYGTTGELRYVDVATGNTLLIGEFEGGAEVTGFAIPFLPGHRVSGNVYYGNTGTTKPMQTNTTVTLTPGSTVSTGAAGYYEFNGIMDGNYTITGASTKPWGGLQALDAIQVQRFVSGALTFTNLQRRAGDVNKSSSVQNLDATFIRRRVSSIAVPQWTAPDWIFNGPFGTPPALQELPITVAGSDLTQELRTLCSGDVNGSYTPPAE